MGAVLNSNHVNYLIWRYLQEQGYGKAAVQLSRDWHFDNPQSLPFSDHVRHYTLVQMLQDAVVYDHLAADARRPQNSARDQHEEAQLTIDPVHSARRWTFIDVLERGRSASTVQSRRVSTSDSGEHKRKRQRRETIDGQRSTVMRRKSLRPTERLPETDADADAMVTDHDAGPADQDAFKSDMPKPVKEELPPAPPPPLPPPTLEIGHSVGVQSEPVADQTVSETIATLTLPDTEIYRVEWDLQDGSNLVVTGGSACHRLKLEAKPSMGVANLEIGEGENEPRPYELISEPILHHQDCVVRYSIMHWEKAFWTGHVAIAIEQLTDLGSMVGSIKVLQPDNELELAAIPNVVLALRWNPNSTRLLAVWDSADGDKSLITTWEMTSSKQIAKTVSSGLIRDAVWLQTDTFACCGDQILDIYTVDAEQVKHTESIETSRPWEEFKYDLPSEMLVCTSSNDGELGLFDTSENVLHTKDAHEDAITSVQWQPASIQNTFADDAEIRLLATACTDGTIKLWNARRALECLHVFTAGPVMPVWSLSFAPDGSKLATVIGDQVQVWEAKVDGSLVAQWSDPEAEKLRSEPGEAQKTEETNCMAEDESGPHSLPGGAVEQPSPVYSLAWDALRQRLALTHGSHISIIQLPKTEARTDEVS